MHLWLSKISGELFTFDEKIFFSSPLVGCSSTLPSCRSAHLSLSLQVVLLTWSVLWTSQSHQEKPGRSLVIGHLQQLNISPCMTLLIAIPFSAWIHSKWVFENIHLRLMLSCSRCFVKSSLKIRSLKKKKKKSSVQFQNYEVKLWQKTNSLLFIYLFFCSSIVLIQMFSCNSFIMHPV